MPRKPRVPALWDLPEKNDGDEYAVKGFTTALATLADAGRVPKVIEFAVYGEPASKGSTHGFAIPLKNRATGQPIVDKQGHPRYRAVVTSTNTKLKQWERQIRAEAAKAARGQFFDGVPVLITIVFGLLRPPSVRVSKRPYPIVAPDVDKYVRGVCDGLSQVVFRDDAQVVAVLARKEYVASGAAVTHVTVREWQGLWPVNLP